MEKSILGIKKKDKIRTKTIREKTKCRGVVHTIQKLKIKYTGHIARMGDERWCRKTTFWISGSHMVTKGGGADQLEVGRRNYRKGGTTLVQSSTR